MIMWFYTHTGLLTLDRGPLFSKGKENSESVEDGIWGRELREVEGGETAVDMYYVRKEKNVMETKKIRYFLL